jgi:small subunit ribosomal protein S11
MLKKKVIDFVNINVKTTKNNTIINITDNTNNMLYIISAGMLGFKGTKKKTIFAAQVLSEKILNKLIDLNIKKVKIFIKGIGNGRDIIIKILSKLSIISIYDKTKIAFNGCRAPKKRRI